jgi:hypothetical protein
VLAAGSREHIVSVTDLSPEGAFLASRVHVDTSQPLRLKMVLPRNGRAVTLPCTLVRQTDRFDPKTGSPAGIAVRFKGLDAAAIRMLEEFAMEGFLPVVEPRPPGHFEYRVLERAEIEESELSRLGIDGWELAAAYPAGKGVKLVLLRRL